MNNKLKPATIIRLIALVLTVVNQAFALFAKDYIGFASSLVYQVITIILTIAVAGYCAWKNNDITKAARLAGALFSALKDGKISPDEINNILGIIKEKTSDEEKPVAEEKIPVATENTEAKK